MKLRGILLIAAFVLFIALTFYWQHYLNKCHDEYASMIDKVEEYVDLKQFDKADEEFVVLRGEFDRKLPYWNICLPHYEIEPVHNAITQLGAQIRNEDYDSSKESITLIKHMLEHIKLLDRLKLDNIF